MCMCIQVQSAHAKYPHLGSYKSATCVCACFRLYQQHPVAEVVAREGSPSGSTLC